MLVLFFKGEKAGRTYRAPIWSNLTGEVPHLTKNVNMGRNKKLYNFFKYGIIVSFVTANKDNTHW